MNAAILLMLAAAQAPGDLATVEGRVVSSVTGKPVKRASVSLIVYDPVEPGGNPKQQDLTPAGVDGRFTFGAVPAGRYVIVASQVGFVAAVAGGAVRPPLVNLKAGERREITVKLGPLGSISGRILDEDGDPSPGVLVQAARYRYHLGRRKISPDEVCETDDRGEYRFFHLYPGKYYIGAIRASRQLRPGYGAAYFPGTINLAEATPVDVGIGQEINELNFRLLPPPPLHRVTVRSASGQRITAPNVTVRPVDAIFWGVDLAFSRADEEAIEYTLPSSRYRITARLEEKGEEPLIASETVDVRSDVDVSLTLRPPIVVRGSMSLPPETAPLATAPRVVLSAADAVDLGELVGDVRESRFVIGKIWPAAFWVRMYQTPQEWYVQSIRWNGEKLPGAILDLSGATGGDLEVVVGRDAGSVSGAVSRTGKVTGSVVALFSVSPDRRDRAREIRIEDRPEFTFRFVPPGDYRVLVLDRMETGESLDPEFAKQYEKHGVAVTVRPSSTEKIDQPIPVIVRP